MSWTNNQYEIRLEQMESDMDDLQTDLTKKDKRIKELLEEISWDYNQYEIRLEQYESEINNLQTAITEKDNRIKKLLNEIGQIYCFLE